MAITAPLLCCRSAKFPLAIGIEESDIRRRHLWRNACLSVANHSRAQHFRVEKWELPMLKRHHLRRRERSVTAVPLDARAQASGSSSTGDILVQGLSELAEVSVYAIVGTDLVREAQLRHQTSPTATAALGRALMGALLLGAFRKDNETVQMTFKGDGPLGQLTVVANGNAEAKGFVVDPSCDLPVNANGKLDVGKAVGNGVLTVVRNASSWRQPYSGSVNIVCGEIAEDITHYLVESEQTNSAVGLGVLVGVDGLVRAAGGFMVQVLPFCSEETLARLEANIQALPSPSAMVDSGVSAEEMVKKVLEGLGTCNIEESTRPSYGPCVVEDLRERMKRTLVLLGQRDVMELIEEQGGVEVKCEFCNELVVFKEEDIVGAFASEVVNS